MRKFLEDLRDAPGAGVVHAGRFGYVAKGIALVIVGGLFVAAAATADPEKAEGLDGALQSITTVPYGKALLVRVAIGTLRLRRLLLRPGEVREGLTAVRQGCGSVPAGLAPEVVPRR